MNDLQIDLAFWEIAAEWAYRAGDGEAFARYATKYHEVLALIG